MKNTTNKFSRAEIIHVHLNTLLQKQLEGGTAQLDFEVGNLLHWNIGNKQSIKS